MGQYFSRQAQELRRAQIDTYFEKQDKELNSSISRMIKQRQMLNPEALVSQEMKRFYQKVVDKESDLNIHPDQLSKDIDEYNISDVLSFQKQPSQQNRISRQHVNRQRLGEAQSIEKITEDELELQSKLQSIYSHDAAKDLLQTCGSGFYKEQDHKIESPPPVEKVLDPTKFKTKTLQIQNLNVQSRTKPYVSRSQRSHKPSLSQMLSPVSIAKSTHKSNQSTSSQLEAYGGFNQLNKSFQGTLTRYQQDFNRLKTALGGGSVMQGDKYKRLYIQFMDKKQKQREAERANIRDTLRKTSLKFHPKLLDAEMTGRVSEIVQEAISSPIKKKSARHSPNILDQEQEEPMTIQPQQELIKMKTKIKNKNKVVESVIPYQAIFNDQLNKFKIDQEKDNLLKAPVTIYFDELRHNQEALKSRNKKLRLLIQGKPQIEVDFSKNEGRKILQTMNQDIPIIDPPGQIIRRQTMMQNPKIQKRLYRKDTFAPKILDSNLKYADDIEKKIYNTLQKQGTRYGKMIKEFFIKEMQGKLSFDVSDIRKGTSMIDELKVRIPEETLDPMNIRRPNIDKYVERPKETAIQRKQTKYNSKWFLKPQSWNQLDGKEESKRKTESPNKLKTNSALSRVLNELEEQADLWDRVSPVEKKIQGETSNKATNLRDNLIDFLFA